MLNLSRIINDTKLLYHSEDIGYVLASYSEAMECPEVMMFKATHEGQVKDWTEIFGEKFPFQDELGKTNKMPSSIIQEVVNTYNNRILSGDEYYNG